MPEEVKLFKYPGPDGEGFRDAAPGRKSYPMCQTDNVVSTVQIFEKGVHNNLHFHGMEDGYWFVLGGQATFYGEGDKVHAVLNRYEGLLMPAGVRYWFECTSDEPLQILRVNYKVPKVRPEALKEEAGVAAG